MQTNAAATAPCDIRDIAFADQGKRHIEWAFQSMPVLQTIRKQFIKTQPLAGIRVSAGLQVTAETANLLVTLRDGGADIVLYGSNPSTTRDDVAASLVRDYNIPVYAIKDARPDVYESHLAAALEHHPQVTIDDGAGLATCLHIKRPESLPDVLGGTESTSAGVARLNAMAKQGALKYPVIAVNEARTKHLFDNRYGTGQSTLDGIIRATNVLLAGLNVVIAGYGWCGRGIAMHAKGMGANIIVTEIDPGKAIEAVMDGFRVMTMADACAIGDVFVTVTGNRGVLSRDHFDRLKSGAILCNAGHLNVEIDLTALAKSASSHREIRPFVEEFGMRDGRKLYILGKGRVIHLASAEGHPASVMDISFANQALCVEHLLKNYTSLEDRCYPVPDAIDKQVARMKLESMSIKIDRLTSEQEIYLASGSEGS
jgi:adenosylhomocysteinase